MKVQPKGKETFPHVYCARCGLTLCFHVNTHGSAHSSTSSVTWEKCSLHSMKVRLIERTHVLTGKLRTCSCGRTHFCISSDAWYFHTNIDFYGFFRTMNNCPFLFAYCTLQNRRPFCPRSHHIDVFCVLMAAIVAAKMTSLTAKLC